MRAGLVEESTDGDPHPDSAVEAHTENPNWDDSQKS